MVENPIYERTLTIKVKLLLYETDFTAEPYIVAQKDFINEHKTLFTLNQSVEVNILSVANSMAQATGLRFRFNITAFNTVTTSDFLLIYWDLDTEGIPTSELAKFTATNYTV